MRKASRHRGIEGQENAGWALAVKVYWGSRKTDS